MLCILLTVSSAPLLKDLYEYVTPEYATDWKTIGILLGLFSEDMNIIEYDKRHVAVHCCNAMWEKWLEVDKTATWEKVFAAIKSPALCRSTLSCKYVTTVI